MTKFHRHDQAEQLAANSVEEQDPSYISGMHLMARVNEFLDEYEDGPRRDLETYLRALLRVVEQHQADAMDVEMLFQMLGEALEVDPLPFDMGWLAITESPDEEALKRKLTAVEKQGAEMNDGMTAAEGIAFSRAVILFQIAELHRMEADGKLEGQYKEFGIKSSTGHYWYNFNPYANIECGAYCIVDNMEDDAELIHITWKTLGILLENGRVYE
jgi:hypothetical protein